MRSRESLIRLNRFQVDEKRRKVAEIETMMADFERKEVDLNQQIEAEQQRSGISDVNHFAYPTFAKAALGRRDNLAASIEGLKLQLEEAKNDLAAAYTELKKYELLQEKERAREQKELSAKEQAEMDEVALNMFRRGEAGR